VAKILRDLFRYNREFAAGVILLGFVVLVAGASQGARVINRAVFEALPKLVEHATVLHVTGAADFDEAGRVRESLDAGRQARYLPATYRDDLPVAMLAADVAVMRAGASTLGELPAASLPAILVPGTYAGGHQRDNARWLVDGGAAVILEESAIAGLAGLVLELLGDGARLGRMRDAAHALARPDAADTIAGLIIEVARR